MNTIEKVNIGGCAFTMDSPSCNRMEAYLAEIESFYASKESGAEIIEGIESRIAELLIERCGSGKVVTVNDVDYIIDTVGHPRQMDTDEEESKDGNGPGRPKRAQAPEENGRKTSKRLYRDRQNGIIGGVCSGIATYLNTDVTWIRLAFIVLTIISPASNETELLLLMPFIYIILMIAIPPAKTVKERWAMKGESADVNNIARNVRSGATEIKDAATNMAHGTTGAIREISKSRAASGAGNIIRWTAGILLLLTGIFGIVAGVVSVLTVFPSDNMSYWMARLQEEAPDAYLIVFDLIHNGWVFAGAALVFFIPFLGLLYGGLRLIFKVRAPKWHPGLIMFLIWVAAVIALLTKVLIVTTSAHLL